MKLAQSGILKLVKTTQVDALTRYRETLKAEYDRRFRRSRESMNARGGRLLDHASHAMRWNERLLLP